MRKMDVRKLRWCFTKHNVSFISPNENLCKDYIESAEETLEELLLPRKKRSFIWSATQKYYFEYFLIYSVLMKIGIKSEIHDCTILISQILEDQELVPYGFTSQLNKDKELRIMNQYYLKNVPVEINVKELRHFLLTFKDILLKITDEDIEKIRKKVQSFLK